MVAQHVKEGDYSTRYRFNGKEQDQATGFYYYGARYYEPSLSRWLSTDPLAEKYQGFSPYNYTLNNPINLVDPDGREVINGDKETLVERKRSYEVYKKTAEYKKYNGLTRGEIKKQYGKSHIENWKKVNNIVKSYKKSISKLTDRATKVDEIIEKWANSSPNLYKKVDELGIDFVLHVDENIDEITFGGTQSVFEAKDGQAVYPFCRLNVYINRGVEIDSIDPETGEYSLNHEAGHFIFAWENSYQYFRDRKNIKAKGEDYDGGHHPDATTGKVAREYGRHKDIE